MYYAFITLGHIIAYGKSRKEAFGKASSKILKARNQNKKTSNKLAVDEFPTRRYSMPLILPMSQELYNIISKEKNCVDFQDFVVCTNSDGVCCLRLQTSEKCPRKQTATRSRKIKRNF